MHPIRWFRYLAMMAPPWIMFPVGCIKFFAAYATFQALSSRSPLIFDRTALLGGITVTLVLMLMRVYDELKDADSDRHLAAAGDPRYTGRPLVIGIITEHDLRMLRNLIVVALISIHIFMAGPWVSLAFGVLLSVLWLSSRWFFWPAIKNSLWLAFITHNPISAIVGTYILAVYVDRFGAFQLSWGACLALILGLWFPVAAWETSRKIRLPSDETDYQTYSKLWGLKIASIIPACFIALASLCLIYVAHRAMLSLEYSFLLAIATGIIVIRSFILFFAPTRARTQLQPWTESFAAIADIGLVAACIASRGIEIG